MSIDLEVSAAADEAHGADDHEGEDDDERHAGGVGEPRHQPEHAGLRGEHPVSVGPAGTRGCQIFSFFFLIKQTIKSSVRLFNRPAVICEYLQNTFFNK